MRRSRAEIVREYGPFPGADSVHGVTYDGRNVWFAAGDKLNAFDPASGETLRSIDVAAHAGTAFDGRHLFQLAGDRIQKIDPNTGRVLAAIRRRHEQAIEAAPAQPMRGLAVSTEWSAVALEVHRHTIRRRPRLP